MYLRAKADSIFDEIVSARAKAIFLEREIAYIGADAVGFAADVRYFVEIPPAFDP